MKNKITLTLIHLCIALILQAQNPISCIVEDNMDDERITLELFIQQKKENTAFQSGSLLSVPIVVHVVYHDTTENISDAQIMSQLDVLAQDYRRLNPDTGNTPAAFASLAGDAEIEFCLAIQDPNGNATTGITRTYTDSLSFYLGPGGGNSMKHDSSGGIDAWDTKNYMNIWIANLAMGGGHATNPAAHGTSDDGVVMNYSVMIGYHLLSHEIAHYFNIMHIYGGVNPLCEGSDGGDQVSDTPDQSWSTSGCPPFPQTDNCTTVSPGIMFMNFMDQTSSACQNLFTQGQVARMRDALTIARASLLVSNGCSATTSINNLTVTDKMNINPNPASDVINLSFEWMNSAEVRIEVLDLTGRIYNCPTTQSFSSGKNNAQLKINDLNPGVYFCRIIFDGQIVTKKFIKNPNTK